MDAAGSTVRPPADVVSSRTAFYGLAGAHIAAPALLANWVDADLAVSGGYGARTGDGRWWTGDAGLNFSRLGRGYAFSSRLDAFGLKYTNPFDYTAMGLSLNPRLSVPSGPVTISMAGNLLGGRWSAPLPTGTSETGVSTDGGLRGVGGSLAVSRSWGSLSLQLTAHALNAVNGSADGGYGGLQAEARYGGARAALHLATTLWQAPSGNEVGYTAGLDARLTDNLRLAAELERSVADPVYGTPGSFGASVGLSIRVGSWRRRPLRPLVDIGAPGAAGRHVRFNVKLPAGAGTVALAGDFTGWQPLAMHPEGAWWTVDTVVPAGAHQFAFVVDGERWMVPAGAPGMVDDGWGRQNVTFVVPPL